MDSGLVTSLSGALAQSRRIEVISNNIANADTVGFKSKDLAFEEAMEAAHREDTRSDISEEAPNESEVLSAKGRERSTVLYGADFVNLQAGGFRQTSNPLDVAIEGNGFLEIATPNGIRLTRAGNLALDAEGRLVNNDGFLVLGPAGQGAAAGADPAARAIRVPSGQQLQIDLQGNIYVRGEAAPQLVGSLSLVQVENPTELKPEGRNLFNAGPNAFPRAAGQPEAERTPASVVANAPELNPRPNPLGPTNVAPKVHQGMLESSNVSPVKEMSSLIEAQRLFEQNLKLMQGTGEMSARLSEIGKF
jgi:flagellar basal-body rod protein FlgF